MPPAQRDAERLQVIEISDQRHSPARLAASRRDARERAQPLAPISMPVLLGFHGSNLVCRRVPAVMPQAGSQPDRRHCLDPLVNDLPQSDLIVLNFERMKGWKPRFDPIIQIDDGAARTWLAHGSPWLRSDHMNNSEQAIHPN